MRGWMVILVLLAWINASHAQDMLREWTGPMRPAPPALLPPTALAPQDLLKPLPPAWSYQELGLFCRLDVQLERHLKMPVILRLGDPLQVEAWEGKGPLHLDRDR